MTPRADVVRQRELDAVRMRRDGASYQQIADTLGYADRSAAFVVVKRAMDKALREAVDEYRELLLSRLDMALENSLPAAREGDPRAIANVVKIVAEQAKITGANAPLKVQQEVTVFEGGTELDREVQRLAELLATNTRSDSSGEQTDLGKAVSTTGTVTA